MDDTIRFFQCTVDDTHCIGFDEPGEGEPLTLFPAAPGAVTAALAAADGDRAAFTDAVTRGAEPLTVPADERHLVRFLPPLLPAAPADALAGGFMQTHNVKTSGDDTVREQPNWFFKGLGHSLRVSGDDLRVPAAAVAVCEEAEVVLVHVCDADGTPRYAGYTFGNDLTDIGRFRLDRGHLSYAKLCDAAVSPWFFAAPPPRHVTGTVTVERNGTPAWQGAFTTGLDALHYAQEDMISHLFSHTALHHPGRVHYVFLGADRSSFHAGFTIAHGDRLTIDVPGHGISLSNTVRWSPR
ncbi:fumarylacetoacetate hydrolase family protein [Streptomyces sp. NPDC002536]